MFVAVAAVEFICFIQLCVSSLCDSIRRVRIFNLCDLIMLVASAAVTIDFLFIMGQFCLIV